MSTRALAISAGVCTTLVVVAAALLELSLGDAVLLAPIIVVTLGATIGIVALWVKIALDSLRNQRHPRRIVLGTVAALAVLVALSFFVDLPARY